MNPCENCGKLNSGETKYCRFCGTKFVFQQPVMDQPYDYAAPRPYSWKTDEFQTQNEPRRTDQVERSGPAERMPANSTQQYHPAPMTYQPVYMSQPFRCPHCMSQVPPRIERRVSTAGWVTFAVLLVVFFPLFWIGLLIKEDVHVCQSCNTKVNQR